MTFFGFGSSGSSGSSGYGRSYASTYPSSYASNESMSSPSSEDMERGLKSIIYDVRDGAKLDFFVDKNKQPTLYKAAEAVIAKGGMRTRKRRNSKTKKSRKTPRKAKQ